MNLFVRSFVHPEYFQFHSCLIHSSIQYHSSLVLKSVSSSLIWCIDWIAQYIILLSFNLPFDRLIFRLNFRGVTYSFSWWLNQPIWKICSLKWIISQGIGLNIQKLFETTTQSYRLSNFTEIRYYNGIIIDRHCRWCKPGREFWANTWNIPKLCSLASQNGCYISKNIHIHVHNKHIWVQYAQAPYHNTETCFFPIHQNSRYDFLTHIYICVYIYTYIYVYVYMLACLQHVKVIKHIGIQYTI